MRSPKKSPDGQSPATSVTGNPPSPVRPPGPVPNRRIARPRSATFSTRTTVIHSIGPRDASREGSIFEEPSILIPHVNNSCETLSFHTSATLKRDLQRDLQLTSDTPKEVCSSVSRKASVEGLDSGGFSRPGRVFAKKLAVFREKLAATTRKDSNTSNSPPPPPASSITTGQQQKTFPSATLSGTTKNLQIPKNCEITVDSLELSIGLSAKGFREAFMDFLISEHSEENLEFWLEVQAFKCNVLPHLIQTDSRRIFGRFIADNCEKPINIDASACSAVVKLMNYPNTSMFDTCEEQVYNLMKRDCFPRFLRSDSYKCSGKDLPYFSPRNLELCKVLPPVFPNPNASEDVLARLKRKGDTTTSSTQQQQQYDITRSMELNCSIREEGRVSLVFMPKLSERFIKDRLSVVCGSCRLVVDDRNYTIPVKEGRTIYDLLLLANLPIKEFSPYLAFLQPIHKIIDTNQNSCYYSGKTIELKKFARISLVLGACVADVMAPWDEPIGKVIESTVFRLKSSMDDFSSFKLKSKKALSLTNCCGVYDKSTVVGGAKKK